jgi:zinc protease
MSPVAVPGLSPYRAVLPNGIVVLLKECPTTPSVTIHAAIRAGSVHEPDGLPGLAHFLSRVIDRGTAGRSAEAIAEELDSCGVTLNVSVTRHLLLITCACLSEDFHRLLALIADVLRRPVFPEGEIETRRGEIVTALRQDEDNPAARAMRGLFGLLYPDGHPYGRPLKGTIESITRIDREALVAFHRARVVPSSLALAVVGDVTNEGALEAVDRAFAGWPGPAVAPRVLPPVVRPAGRRRLVFPMMNKAQADVAYGFATIPRADAGYYALWMMNNILGQYGLGGRLGDNIRERQGMAYYAFSSCEPSVAEAPLIIRAGVDATNVDRAVAAIDEEVARMGRQGATAEELAETRDYLVGSLPRMLETNEGIASFLQLIESFDLGLDYDQRLPDLLGAVTLDQVRETAARFLDPARAAVVVAGPYEAGGRDAIVSGR